MQTKSRGGADRVRTTIYLEADIKHLVESANFKGGTFNKHRNGLIGSCIEMPTVSYRRTVMCHVTERHETNIHYFSNTDYLVKFDWSAN